MGKRCWKTGIIVASAVLCLILLYWRAAQELSQLVTNDQQIRKLEVVDSTLKAQDISLYANHTLVVVMQVFRHDMIGAIAVVNSIISNTHSAVHFYLIAPHDIADHLWAWIKKSKLSSTQVTILTFPRSIVSKPIQNFREERLITHSRFYLPSLLPEDTNRVAFISTDCIIQGDIADLVSVTLEPGTYAAFSDDCTTVSKRFNIKENTYASHLQLMHRYFKGLHLNPVTCSFDTSVMITDLKEWRRHNLTLQLEHWLELSLLENFQGSHSSKDNFVTSIMFIVFHRRITNLDPLWNVRHLGLTAGSRYSSQFLREAQLLQWDGPFKPWGRQSSHTDLWERYYVPDPTGKFKPIRKYVSKKGSDTGNGQSLNA